MPLRSKGRRPERFLGTFCRRFPEAVAFDFRCNPCWILVCVWLWSCSEKIIIGIQKKGNSIPVSMSYRNHP
ncbi:unnamed protein product [Hermetia illucens]|uniref:Uncharacterized protein n=1 Tax=Hermetia illucens TaxID=343691 RepID=A0A7R8YR27_HERIL|nr:unnamed protein product [Hermetia illucens]